MVDFSRYIDQYCERTVPGLMSEPLNFFSNLSFILCGILTFRYLVYCNLSPETKRPWYLVSFMAITVGIGSATFHSVATLWAQIADVAPIGILLLIFIANYVRFALGKSWAITAAVLVGFFGVTLAFEKLVNPTLVNGSQMYFGTVLMLVALSFDARHRQLWATSRCFAYACGLFVLSLTFRSIDIRYCTAWPIGTHFLWHLCNGIVIYLAFHAAMNSLVSRKPSAPSNQ